MNQRDPLLYRLGRSAARHRGRFVGTWLVLVVLGFVTSLGLAGNQSLFDRLQSGDIEAPGQAQTGRDLLGATGDRGLSVLLRVDGRGRPGTRRWPGRSGGSPPGSAGSRAWTGSPPR